MESATETGLISRPSQSVGARCSFQVASIESPRAVKPVNADLDQRPLPNAGIKVAPHGLVRGTESSSRTGTHVRLRNLGSHQNVRQYRSLSAPDGLKLLRPIDPTNHRMGQHNYGVCPLSQEKRRRYRVQTDR
jgi:hypothetical protein